MASKLKQFKKDKESKDSKDEGADVLDDLGGAPDGDSKEDKPEPKDKPEGSGDDKPAEDTGGEAPAAAADGTGDDPVKVFTDVLELDDMTAQAVYAEAMAMPDLADMSPDQMAKKIKGNYDLLKKILQSMGEKAAAVARDELNKPMDMPDDMGGPAGPGGDLGPPPGL